MSEQQQAAFEAEKRQISILRSGNVKAILTTLEEIRIAGNLSILPEIFDLLLVSTENEVIKASTALLNDIKNPEASQLLLSAIKNKKYKPILHILVSACWQNGLDYHSEIQTFAKILLIEDYLTALEAFTLIENNLGELDDASIVKLTATLKNGQAKVDENKKNLVNELITSIKTY